MTRAIDWPPGLEPENCAFVAENTVFCDVAPERIWAWLVRPLTWPDHYPGASSVRFVRGSEGPLLSMGACISWRVSWRMMSLRVTATIDRFEENAYLGWSGSGFGTRAHHVWTLERDGKGTRFYTAEAQRGPGSKVLAPILKKRIEEAHQSWLEGLVRAAEKSAPR
ncbi:MAG: SRPBCC family protein [Polyangiaceae bacterium]